MDSLAELSAALRPYVVTHTDSEEEIVAHFVERGYERISYHERPVFLFTHERDFADRRHIVSLHSPGPALPEHIYQYPILNYCLSGRWEIVANGEPVELQPGECLLTDRNVTRSVPRTALDMIGVNLILNEQYFATHLLASQGRRATSLERELVRIGASHDQWRHFLTADDELVRTLMTLILQEFMHPTKRGSDVVDALGEALITHLLGTYEQNGAEEGSGQSELMGAIRDYIATNFREGSMTQMAADLGYQRTYLSRVIKRSTSNTFKQLVNAERMKRATVLLQASNQPIYEIAEEVGIPNLTSFYQRFRAWARCTPQEWRDRAK